MELRLENIQNGYAEFYDDESGIKGYVQLEYFVDHTDFEEDVIYEVTRWVPYLYTGFDTYDGHSRVGRKTGYLTRNDALTSLDEYVDDYAIIEE